MPDEIRADNYLTKAFDEEVLDSRIESAREQILDLLMSSLDNALDRYARVEAQVATLE